jgi:hypothetical protein
MPDTLPLSEPWERQPGEPNLWFSRFQRYLLAGPSRSLLGTVNGERTEKGREKQSKVPGSWNQAFARWNWRERAEAWDERVRHEAREAHAHDVEEMNRRHIQEAQALQNKAVQRLRDLKVEELSVTDTLRFVIEATKLERTARGEPETIEERRLTGKSGGPVTFSMEDAVTAEKELKEWHHDRLLSGGREELPDGGPKVP